MPTDKQQLTAPTTSPAPNSSGAIGSYRHRLLVALSGVVLIVALSSASLLWLDYQTKHDAGAATSVTSPQKAAAAASDVEVSCDKDLMKYRNEDQRVGFCYPSAWGTVSIKDARYQSDDSGLRRQVTFADNKAMYITLTSKDWSSKTKKDTTCTNPAVQVDEASFVQSWQAAKPTPAAATTVGILGYEMVPGKYLIREVASTETKGVCMEGYAKLGGKTYASGVLTTAVAFTPAIPTVDAHMSAPFTLLTAQARADIADVVRSIVEL